MEKYVVTSQNLMEILDRIFDSEIAVYVPQNVASRTDIGSDSKFYFGIIFDECARNITSPYHCRQAAETVKHYIRTLTANDVKINLECSSERAAAVKEELVTLTNTVDLEKCFEMCSINFVDRTGEQISRIENQLNIFPLWKRSCIIGDIINFLDETE